MRRKLACGAGGATLRLGRDAPLVAKCRRKPDCRARTNPEHAGRSPTGMPRRNVVKHTLSQIHRICFAHETPPVGSESHIQTYGNPPRFRSNAKCFKTNVVTPTRGRARPLCCASGYISTVPHIDLIGVSARLDCSFVRLSLFLMRLPWAYFRPTCFAHKSGLRSFVIASACARRHLAISPWWPDCSTSGIGRSFQTTGLVNCGNSSRP